MAQSLRTPFLIAGFVVLLIAVLVEVGSGLMAGGGTPRRNQFEKTAAQEISADAQESIDLKEVDPKETRPGYGIPYLAFLDTLLLLMTGLMVLSLSLTERLYARLHGIITLVVTVLDALASFAGIFVAASLLMTMLGLFMAAPFGTLAYLAVWGFFDRAGAAAVLGLVLALKLVFAVLLVIAHPGFLQNKGFVLLTLTSLLANVIVSLLHALMPGILVSILDAGAAIVVGILGLGWAIALFLGSIGSVLKALKLEKSSA